MHTWKMNLFQEVKCYTCIVYEFMRIDIEIGKELYLR